MKKIITISALLLAAFAPQAMAQEQTQQTARPAFDNELVITLVARLLPERWRSLMSTIRYQPKSSILNITTSAVSSVQPVRGMMRIQPRHQPLPISISPGAETSHPDRWNTM